MWFKDLCQYISVPSAVHSLFMEESSVPYSLSPSVSWPTSKNVLGAHKWVVYESCTLQVSSHMYVPSQWGIVAGCSLLPHQLLTSYMYTIGGWGVEIRVWWRVKSNDLMDIYESSPVVQYSLSPVFSPSWLKACMWFIWEGVVLEESVISVLGSTRNPNLKVENGMVFEHSRN